MTQALRRVWREMGSLEAVASVVTAWRKAPSCMAPLVPRAARRPLPYRKRAALLSALQPLPLYRGPTQDGLFLGQGRSAECASKASIWRERGERCLLLVS